jgi:ABC-type glycerol-3-phosphate transport system permease component
MSSETRKIREHIDEVTSGLKLAVGTSQTLFISLFLTLIAGIIVLPLYIIFLTAVRPGEDIFSSPLALPASISFENFVRAWFDGGINQYIMNSAIVVLVSVAIIIFICSLAAYAFVRFDFTAKQYIFYLILAGFAIPPQVLLIPEFLLMNELGLLNNYLGLIIVYVTFGIPVSAFFLRQYLSTLPDSLAEAARLDGLTEFEIFAQIYMPMSIPAITAVGVIQFVWLWNEFLYAIVFMTDDSTRTVTAGLVRYSGSFITDWGGLAGAIFISVLPTMIIFYTFRRQFARGFTMGRVE